MNAVDTNVLIYARDPRDARKCHQAARLVDTLEMGVLLWQVSCEFIAASRKLAPFGFTAADAWRDLQQLQRSWVTVLLSWDVQTAALEVMRRYGTSFWDALLISACAEAGVTTLYSEDFGELESLNGVRLINPFADGL